MFLKRLMQVLLWRVVIKIFHPATTRNWRNFENAFSFLILLMQMLLWDVVVKIFHLANWQDFQNIFSFQKLLMQMLLWDVVVKVFHPATARNWQNFQNDLFVSESIDALELESMINYPIITSHREVKRSANVISPFTLSPSENGSLFCLMCTKVLQIFILIGLEIFSYNCNDFLLTICNTRSLSEGFIV